MIVLDEMPNLEGKIERGILLLQLVEASKNTAITFDDGIILIRGVKLGTRGADITNDLLEYAVKYLMENNNARLSKIS